MAATASTGVRLGPTLLALAGMGLAAFLYLGDPAQVMAIRRLLMPLYIFWYLTCEP